MMKKILFLLLVLLSVDIYSQCTSCGVTNPTSGNFAANTTYCFTANTTFSDVTLANNVKICIAPGVTLTIQNNINYATSNPAVTFEIAGTMLFGQSPQISANLTVNIQSGGILRAGSSGNNNFTFNGSGTNTLTNYGTVNVSVLGFNSSSATNIIDNYGTYTIAQNINISGNTTFRNNGTLNIGQSYNNNSTSSYINCGTINSSVGYNLGGGKVINTGTFNVGTGSIDMSGNSSMYNYGILTSTGTLNMNSSSAIFYNEGLTRLTNWTTQGWIKGPDSSSKKGYIYVVNKATNNNLKVGPNLDFTRYTSNTFTTVSASQGQTNIFNNTPTYVNSSGTTVTQTVANVTYNCTSGCPSLVTSIGLCPNVDGSFPPVAVDDAYTINSGNSSATSILINDLEQYNGVAATTSNVIITQVSTTNSNVNVNTSTGLVTVASGTSGGTYTIVYQICRTSYPTSCATATVTITVPSSVCYKSAVTSGTTLDTLQGITALARAGSNADNWPMVRKGGWTALEALTKGFVLNRLTNAQITAITNPVEGMLVYSITDDCLKINTDGTSSGWKCFTKQDCPD